MALDSAGRLREEDPFTGMLVAGFPNRVVSNISRFCVDLNRSLDKAIYLKPADAWNLKVWNQPLCAAQLARLQRMHDGYYIALEALLKGLERDYGRFVVLDVHSYNHRRAGPDGAPTLEEQAPDINIGTFSMDRKRWAPVVDRFIEFCAAHSIQDRPLDVRENIAFEGRGEQTRFIHEQFPETGCAIAVEIKKIFMDEWTGAPDYACIQQFQALLTAAVPILEQVLDASMTSASRSHGHDPSGSTSFEAEFSVARFIRSKLPGSGRIHVDRPLPFICLHYLTHDMRALAAEQLCAAQAAHVIGGSKTDAAAVVENFARLMTEEFGSCLVIEVHELAEDRCLKDDSPLLPPFDIVVSRNDANGAAEAMDAFNERMTNAKMRYRTPHLVEGDSTQIRTAGLDALSRDVALLSIGISPIYRQSRTEAVYPELLQQLVAELYDAVLEAVAAHVRTATVLEPKSHRSFGRKTIIDAVHRVDRQVDAISSSFDFVLQLTPIDTEAAWHHFRHQRFFEVPEFHYRPLSFDVQSKKRELFSISFDQLEDPVLTELFDEKRRELDLQLTMLNERGSARAKDTSRVIYGSVEPELRDTADDILGQLDAMQEDYRPPSKEIALDSLALRARAESRVADYRKVYSGFTPTVEVRDDIPAGLMVSGPRLLISRATTIPEQRVEAILCHEIGVHLVTYFNGNEQGLRLLRSGLAGYEGMQEGLAVFAEYAVGGLTSGRLRLLAARVLACHAMLEGADFIETFRLLSDKCGISGRGAFHAAMRVHRSGGLAKDAIYLRGLLHVLRHLRHGGALDILWIGKIAEKHFSVMGELLDRGLLKSIPLFPHFLSDERAASRIKNAGKGLSPIQLLAQ